MNRSRIEKGFLAGRASLVTWNREQVFERLKQARVARLATADAEGRPHLVPICFAYDGRCFYTSIDRKRKKTSPENLTRARNIRANPNVSLLVDEYGEDWGELWYILVRGQAALLDQEAERKEARKLLQEKYPQYARPDLLPEDALLIRITPTKMVSWRNADPKPSSKGDR